MAETYGNFGIQGQCFIVDKEYSSITEANNVIGKLVDLIAKQEMIIHKLNNNHIQEIDSLKHINNITSNMIKGYC